MLEQSGTYPLCCTCVTIDKLKIFCIIHNHIPRKCDFTPNCGDDVVQVLYNIMLLPTLLAVCLSWIIASENELYLASHSVVLCINLLLEFLLTCFVIQRCLQ